MSSVNHYAKNRSLTVVLVLLMAFISSIVLQGCGGSSGSSAPAPLPDQDASGLFKSGTAELNSGATMLNDLRAFVYQGRIMMFSVAGHILYDGQINSITSDDFTATVDVYEAGVKTQTGVSVSGQVISQSKISGTIAGTGSHSGTFELIYDLLYTRGASFARVDTTASQYSGAIMNSNPGAGTNNFDFYSATGYDLQSFTSSRDRCTSDAVYNIPNVNINIYVLNETLTRTSDPGCTMTDTPNYTGFAAAVDGTVTDDTLVYAVSNGTNAQFAILIK